MKEYKLPNEVKEKLDSLFREDSRTLSQVVITSFIAGMQLAIRVCRNRARDIPMTEGMWKIRHEEAETCAQLIRICQVELGSGRMDKPKFTPEELDEMDRIS